MANISIAQYSPIIGGWKGYLLTDTSNADNRTGLPVVMNISDSNNKGEFAGDMTIQYRYQTDIYRVKYVISGNFDESTSVAYIEQEKIVYYDLLPKGLKWCFGSGYFKLQRNPYRKKIYLDGTMTTDCGDDPMRFVLIKK